MNTFSRVARRLLVAAFRLIVRLGRWLGQWTEFWCVVAFSMFWIWLVPNDWPTAVRIPANLVGPGLSILAVAWFDGAFEGSEWVDRLQLSWFGRYREYYVAGASLLTPWLMPSSWPDLVGLLVLVLGCVTASVLMGRAGWYGIGVDRRRRHRFGKRVVRRLSKIGVTSKVTNKDGETEVKSPTVKTVVRRGGATTVRIGVPIGHSVDTVSRHADALASAFDARAVTVDPCDTAGVVDVTVHSGADPLAEVSSAWPGLELDRSSWLDPIPVGWNAYGEPLAMKLWQAHVLCAGQTGSGKSVWLHQLMVWAALDPSVMMLIVDPKAGAELGCYRPRAAAFASDQEEAVELFRQVRAEIERRNREATNRKADGVSPGQRPVLLFIDELAAVLAGGDRRLAMEATELLQYIVAVGRSRGVSVIAGTQRPSADLIPGAIRSQFQYLVAFRLQREGDTTIVFGDNPPGVHPERISLNERGVGYMMTDEGALTRFRSYYLDDGTLFDGETVHPSPLLAAAAERHRLAVAGGVTADGELITGGEADLWDPPVVDEDEPSDTGSSLDRPDRPSRKRSPRKSVRDREGGDE